MFQVYSKAESGIQLQPVSQAVGKQVELEYKPRRSLKITGIFLDPSFLPKMTP
jgi:hypothetical protein